MVTWTDFKNANQSLAKFVSGLLVFTACIASTVSAVEVEATLDRDAVAAGNAAILTLRIAGGKAGQPQIPQVQNLIVQPRGQSQQMQMINGHTTVSVSYNYIVGSNTPGDYEIPSIEITVDQKKYSTKPIKLKVLDSATAQPPAGMAPTPSGQQSAQPEVAETGEKRFGFLTVELADSKRKHVYVGEIAPVRIRAWLPSDSRAQLRSVIQPEGKAFTLHNVSGQPQQTEEVRDGKRYLVVTWFGGISATKAGKYPASLSVNANVAVRDTAALQQPRRRMGAFGDPFFDSIFDQMHTPMIQKDVTLKSDDQEIEVRPLPTQGRPKGFAGAVGEFKFEESQIPSDWKTGEPQQVTVKLGGAGNFALMKAPQLSPADNWKSYSGKDEFTAGDQASFSGSKVFQFSVVPLKTGAQELALSFSYFDPAVEVYKTITTPMKKIHVTGSDVVDAEPPVAAAAEVHKLEKKLEGIVGQHADLGLTGSLVPLVSRPLFQQLSIATIFLLVMGGLFGWLRKHREDPNRRALAAMEKATLDALEAARKCEADRDVAGYFAAGRLAVQQRLSAQWNQPAQAITLAEINARISPDSAVARFFREADLHEYNPQISGEILPQWRALLDEAMFSLNSSDR